MKKSIKKAQALLALGCICVLTMAGYCGGDTEQTTEREPASQPVSKVDQFFSLAKEFSEHKKSIDDLKAPFSELKDDEVKTLGEAKSGDFYLTHYLAKGQASADTATLLDQFLSKLEAAKAKDLVQKKVDSKTALGLVRDSANRPQSENDGDRHYVAQILLHYDNAQVNDDFDSAFFNGALSKMNNTRASALYSTISDGNLTTWIGWTITNKTSGRSIFKNMYGQAAPAKKTGMFNKLWTAVQPNNAELNALVIDMAGPDAWGVSNMLNTKLNDVVAAQYAAPAGSGGAAFQALYAAVGAPEKTMMVQALAKAANAAGAADALIADIAPLGANVWGLQAAHAANIKIVLETAVAEYYAAPAGPAFQALHAAVGAPEQALMVQALAKLAIAAGAAQTTALIADIAVGGPNIWGLNAAHAANIKTVLKTAVAEHYAATAGPAFQALHAAVGAPEQALMLKALAKLAIVAGAAQTAALVADIAPTGANIWGLNAAHAANIKTVLETAVAEYYATAAGPAFQALHAAVGAPEKALMVQALAKLAIAAGTAQTVALIADIAPLGPNIWGLNAAHAANIQTVLETAVAEHYAAAAGPAFQALHTAVGAPEQALMVQALAKLAIAAGTAQTAALIADIAPTGANIWGLNAAHAAHIATIIETAVAGHYAAAAGPAFQALHTAVGAPEKALMVQAMAKLAIAAGTAQTAALIADIAPTGANIWGLNAAHAAHITTIIETAVAGHYAATDGAAFQALHASVGAPEQALMVQALTKLAIAAGAAQTAALIADIAPAGANIWGLNVAHAAHITTIIETAVAGHYAATDGAAFKTLYAAVGVPEKALMVKTLAKLANAAGTVQTAALITDIAPTGPNIWGLHASHVINIRAIVETVVAEHYAVPAGGGAVAFKNLLAAVSGGHKRLMAYALARSATTAGPAQVAALITDIAPGGHNIWGLNGAHAANIKLVLTTAVKMQYEVPVGGGAADFQALYAAVPVPEQKFMRNLLVATAYEKGKTAAGHGPHGGAFDSSDYAAAVQSVSALIPSFFSPAEAVGNIFDPAWNGGAAVGQDSRLLWSVIQKAVADLATLGLAVNDPNAYLTAAMVNSLAAPLKALFGAAPIDPSNGAGGLVGAAISWQDYLKAADNETGPNKAIEKDLIRANIATAVANGAYVLVVGVSEKSLARDAAWLDY